MKPSKEKIKKEVKELKRLKPKVRHYSIFNTDNRAQIDAQITVLEENLDNDEIFDKYDHSGVDEEILETALEARSWLNGESDLNTLSEDWKVLADE